MATHYGNMKATFYRDFVTQQILNPSAGSIGGPIAFSRSTSGTYIGSDGYIKTAAANEPRFAYEYDSNGVLQYRGLYIDSRTSYNLFLYSEDLSNAYWTKTNGSVSSTSTLSPNGVDNAQKLSLTSAGGSINRQVTVSGGTVGSGTSALKRVLYISLFAKAAECSYLNIKVDNGTENIDCYYNLGNGTTGINTCGLGCLYSTPPIGTSLAGMQYIYKHICNMSNGWYRCILCVQDPQLAASQNFTVTFSPSTSASSLTINNSNDGILLWGAMFDYGLNVSNLYHSCFSNYIKTTIATSQSFADTCSVSTSNATENNLLAGYSADSCSIYAEFTMPYFFVSTINGTVVSLGATSKYNAGNSMSMRILTNLNNQGSTGYVNQLYRPPGQPAYDFNMGAPVAISSSNNKMLITNRQYAPLVSAMNGIIGISSSSLVPQRFNTMSMVGTVCYKKIFYIPTYLNTSQVTRLTTL